MNKIIKLSAGAVGFLIRVLIFILLATNVCGVVNYFIDQYNRTLVTETILPFLGVGILLISFFSLVRYSVLFNADMREAFMRDHENVESFVQKLCFFFRHAKVTVSFLALIIVYFLIPLDVWFPARFVFFGEAPIGLNERLAVFPYALAILTFFAFRACFSALNFWSEDLFLPNRKRFNYSYSNYVKKILILTVAYYAGSIVLLFGLKMILELLVNNSARFNEKTLFTILAFVVIFFVVPLIYRNISALIKRKSFLKKLGAICKQYDLRLSEIKHPYKSLFKSYDEYNFEFEKNGKKYACKMIHSKHRLRPMSFYEEGVGAISKIVMVKKTEIYRKNTYFRYGYEADAKKLLVVNPVPKTLYVCANGRTDLIDNGDRVWEYKVYSATALINAIDRNTLDR